MVYLRVDEYLEGVRVLWKNCNDAKMIKGMSYSTLTWQELAVVNYGIFSEEKRIELKISCLLSINFLAEEIQKQL